MDEADVVFKALADPTRRALLDELHREAATTGELIRFQIKAVFKTPGEANPVPGTASAQRGN